MLLAHNLYTRILLQMVKFSNMLCVIYFKSYFGYLFSLVTIDVHKESKKILKIFVNYFF